MKERRLSSIELRNVDKTELGWLVSMKKGAEAQAAYWFRSRAPVRTDSAFQKVSSTAGPLDGLALESVLNRRSHSACWHTSPSKSSSAGS